MREHFDDGALTLNFYNCINEPGWTGLIRVKWLPIIGTGGSPYCFQTSGAGMSTSTDFSATRRGRPIGICPRCHGVVRAFELLDKKCARPLSSGAKCPGVIRSAPGADDWVECPECHATGRADDGVCVRCNGEGWLYDKRRLSL